MARLGIIGARGFVGAEFLQMAVTHPHLEIHRVCSDSLSGSKVSDTFDFATDTEIKFEHADPSLFADEKTDVWVIAQPNGWAREFSDAIEKSPARVIDLSADFRFDNGWVYGLPERNRIPLHGARRVSNPGCYATACQLAVLPIVDELAATPSLFGVSGYSGAGHSPSARNDPDRITDNLLPYQLTGHMHEREVSHQIGRSVNFMPHVAQFFRGISLTANLLLSRETDVDRLLMRYRDYYAEEALIDVTIEAPEIRQLRRRPGAAVGGFSVDAENPCRFVVVVALDNLMKGAASQALQNINLMCDFDEFDGLHQI